MNDGEYRSAFERQIMAGLKESPGTGQPMEGIEAKPDGTVAELQEGMDPATGPDKVTYNKIQLGPETSGGLLNEITNEEDLKIQPDGSPASGAQAVLNVAKRLAAEGQQGEAERILKIATGDKGEGAKNDQGADQHKK